MISDWDLPKVSNSLSLLIDPMASLSLDRLGFQEALHVSLGLPAASQSSLCPPMTDLKEGYKPQCSSLLPGLVTIGLNILILPLAT